MVKREERTQRTDKIRKEGYNFVEEMEDQG
jgi:hypothetical protein